MTHELPSNNPQGQQAIGQPSDEQVAPAEQSRRVSPQIWIGSLADYNKGDLHGKWLDAAREPEEIHGDIQAMLASGPAARRGEAPEEWGIFDYEGFGDLRLGEYEAIEDVARLAIGIAEHGMSFGAWVEEAGRENATAENFTEAYCGHFGSAADYAEQLVDDVEGKELLETAMPEWLRPYITIDYDALASDMELGGDIFTARLKTAAYMYITQFDRG
jgi:antirestriction protein